MDGATKDGRSTACGWRDGASSRHGCDGGQSQHAFRLEAAGATAGRDVTGWNEVDGATEAGIKVGWNLLVLVAERLRIQLTVEM